MINVIAARRQVDDLTVFGGSDRAAESVNRPHQE